MTPATVVWSLTSSGLAGQPSQTSGSVVSRKRIAGELHHRGVEVGDPDQDPFPPRLQPPRREGDQHVKQQGVGEGADRSRRWRTGPGCRRRSARTGTRRSRPSVISAPKRLSGRRHQANSPVPMNDQPTSGVRAAPPVWTSPRWSLESETASATTPADEPDATRARPAPGAATSSDQLRKRLARRARSLGTNPLAPLARSGPPSPTSRGWRSARPRARRRRSVSLRGDLESVEVRELDVEQDQVGAQPLAPRRSPCAVARLADHLVAVGLEQQARAGAESLVVVDDENGASDMARFSRSRRSFPIRITAPLGGRSAARQDACWPHWAGPRRWDAGGDRPPHQRSDHEPHNIASRAARWSASHRRTAILGWIAFVVLSLACRERRRHQNIADEDQGNGDSRTAERILADAGFPEDASEQVFVQARGD